MDYRHGLFRLVAQDIRQETETGSHNEHGPRSGLVHEVQKAGGCHRANGR
jgi:hypothetical protein